MDAAINMARICYTPIPYFLDLSINRFMDCVEHVNKEAES